MTGTVLSNEMLSLSKSVQEMAMDGDEPPPRYIVKESTFGSALPPLADVPTIDVSLLSSSSLLSSNEAEAELQNLRSALSSWGCFQDFVNFWFEYAINHGISLSFLNKVREAGRKFFALPMEEKRKYSREVNSFQGYGNDPIVSENQVLDWCDRLILMVFPEDQRKLNLWPQIPNDFGEILHEYAMKIKSMNDLLFKAMAKSLNLEENSFLNYFRDRAMVNVRFNFYPHCSRPDLVFGVKPHADGSGITVLLQDEEVEGLQFLKDDRWYRVPSIPHALVVNLGGQSQIMSNGIFKSPMHRVATNPEKNRISLAVFEMPAPDKEIEPLDGLVDEKRPRLYRKVKNYADINYQCLQKGIVALDAFKI